MISIKSLAFARLFAVFCWIFTVCDKILTIMVVTVATEWQQKSKESTFITPLEYADLILNGDPVKYLKTVTVYKPFEN